MHCYAGVYALVWVGGRVDCIRSLNAIVVQYENAVTTTNTRTTDHSVSRDTIAKFANQVPNMHVSKWLVEEVQPFNGYS